MAPTQNIFNKPVVYNIGYQHHHIESFIRTLQSNSVDTLIDLRERPYSRTKGFSKNQLKAALEAAGICYQWMGAMLGGFTIPRETWLLGCERVAKMAQSQTVVMMCMEADFKQCHRRELADILATEHKVHCINL